MKQMLAKRLNPIEVGRMDKAKGIQESRKVEGP
jgi:hypothetical protein